MEAQKNGQHFKVECQIDGEWFGSDYVFPDQATALAFKRHEEEHGSGSLYRVIPTNAPVNLPLVEDEGDGNAGEPSDDDPSSSFDWAELFELSVLCPTTFCRPSDGDLDRIYSQCRDGCPLQGRVFS